MLYFYTGGRFTKDCLLLSINRWKIHIANSTSGHQIATMFWTWHGSTAPVPWAKLCSDLFIRMRMRAKRNTHRIWIANFSNHFLHFCKNRGVSFLAAKLRNKTSVTPIHSAVIGSRFDWIWTQYPLWPPLSSSNWSALYGSRGTPVMSKILFKTKNGIWSAMSIFDTTLD